MKPFYSIAATPNKSKTMIKNHLHIFRHKCLNHAAGLSKSIWNLKEKGGHIQLNGK